MLSNAEGSLCTDSSEFLLKNINYCTKKAHSLINLYATDGKHKPSRNVAALFEYSCCRSCFGVIYKQIGQSLTVSSATGQIKAWLYPPDIFRRDEKQSSSLSQDCAPT